MGISFHKRIKIGDDLFLNISKSGVSVSKKMGKCTVNSKGNITVNLGNGLVCRDSIKKSKSKNK